MDFGLIVLSLLAVIGMTHIIVDGTIFLPVRNFLKKWLPSKVYQLFECYQCCGTWCGFFIGWLLFGTWSAVIAVGFAGSFVATWGATYLNYLEAQTLVNLGDEEDEKVS